MKRRKLNSLAKKLRGPVAKRRRISTKVGGTYVTTLVGMKGTPYDILKNPSVSELKKLGLDAGDNLRSVVVYEDMYVWNAYQDLHPTVIHALGFPEAVCIRMLWVHSQYKKEVEGQWKFGLEIALRSWEDEDWPCIDWTTHPYFQSIPRLFSLYRVNFDYRLGHDLPLFNWNRARQIQPLHKGEVIEGVSRVAGTCNLQYTGLEPLLEGKPTKLYHGSTADFIEFDLRHSRKQLVDKFYGGGFFFVAAKKTAQQYALGARNIGLPPSVIDDLAQVNPQAARFLREMYTEGRSLWDRLTPEAFGVMLGEEYSEALWRYCGGIDPNVLDDIAEYIVGTKRVPYVNPEFAAQEEIFRVLTGGNDSTPAWIYKDLNAIGLQARNYMPRIYTVWVTLNNILVTDDQEEARAAWSKGYDGIIYCGDGLINGDPEVAVLDPARVRIESVEIIDMLEEE